MNYETATITRTVTQTYRVAGHGTVTAYKRHRRRGEQACEACKEANRVKSADNRRLRRGDL